MTVMIWVEIENGFQNRVNIRISCQARQVEFCGGVVVGSIGFGSCRADLSVHPLIRRYLVTRADARVRPTATLLRKTPAERSGR
jgi:hypothetical protein